MKTVYIETSIVSYLTARPARDLIAAAWQNATSSWWTIQRLRFELYTSQLVVEEAEQGDPDAAGRRLAVLSQLPHLAVGDGRIGDDSDDDVPAENQKTTHFNNEYRTLLPRSLLR